MISFEDWITSSGKYKDRANSPELTDLVKNNAVELLSRVNAALKHLGVEKVSISSGFRPLSANLAANGAKNSTHRFGQGIDIVDSNHKLSRLFTLEILEKFDLYREDDDYTPTWLHLDLKKRKNRIFRP